MIEPEARGFTGFWIPVEIIEEEALTWTQRLIWAEVHALQKGRLGKCIAENAHFMSLFHISEGTVQNALTQLKKQGWLTWQTEDGHREMQALWPDPSFPKIGFPKSGFPKSGKEIPEIGNRLYRENSIENSITPIVPKKKKKSKPKPEGREEEIEAIYEAYPKHVGKPDAVKKIRTALDKIPFPDLLIRVKSYAEARQGEDPKFTPHPATWFNQERYMDPTPTQKPKHDGTNNSTPDFFWKAD